MLNAELLAQPVEHVRAAGFLFLAASGEGSVNWLPLSVISLTILTGQACSTLVRKSTLLLSV